MPRAQVALAWVLQKQGVTAPIVGASKPQHLTDAVAALSLKLTAEEIAPLEAPYVPHKVAGFLDDKSDGLTLQTADPHLPHARRTIKTRL